MSNSAKQADQEGDATRERLPVNDATARAAILNNNPFGIRNLADPQSPWVRAAQLPSLFCSWDVAYRCTSSGWLKPIVQGKRRTIYRLSDVLDCLDRIEKGELPPVRSK
jgi:hypothetical protein